MFDLGSGGFSHLELTDKHGAEALDRGAPLAGEIRIGDRNYARVPVLKRFLAAGGGKSDFIVRAGWNALQLSNTSRFPSFRPCTGRKERLGERGNDCKKTRDRASNGYLAKGASAPLSAVKKSDSWAA